MATPAAENSITRAFKDAGFWTLVAFGLFLPLIVVWPRPDRLQIAAGPRRWADGDHARMRPMPTRGSAHEEVTVPLRHLTAA